MDVNGYVLVNTEKLYRFFHGAIVDRKYDDANLNASECSKSKQEFK